MKKLIMILITLLFCMSCISIKPGRRFKKSPGKIYIKPKTKKKPNKKSYSLVVMQSEETQESVELVTFFE